MAQPTGDRVQTPAVLVHQTFIPGINLPQVVEGWRGYKSFLHVVRFARCAEVEGVAPALVGPRGLVAVGVVLGGDEAVGAIGVRVESNVILAARLGTFASVRETKR